MEGFGKQVEEFRKQIRRDAADFQLWNLSPILSLHECICLLIGIDPNVIESRLKNSPYWKIRRTADSHHEYGSLKCIQTGKLTFWPGKHDAREFIVWAKSIGIDPPANWCPQEPRYASDINGPIPRESVPVIRYKEALVVAIEMRSSDKIETPRSLVKDILPYMKTEYIASKRFQKCFDEYMDEEKDLENLANSIRKGGRLLGHEGSPLKNSDFLNSPDIPKANI